MRSDAEVALDSSEDSDCGDACAGCGYAVSFSAFGEDVYFPGVNAAPSAGFTWDFWFKAVALPTSSAVNISAGATLLIAADGVGCEDIYVGFGTESTPANVLAFNVDGFGGCNARDGSPIDYTPPGGFETGRWYFVAVSHDYSANVSWLYVNGALVASKTADVATIPRVLPFTAGRWTDHAVTEYNQFEGAIDEPHVFGRVLTAAEVSIEYGAGGGRYGTPSDSKLIAGYHFDDGSGSAASSFATGGAAGVLEGSASWVAGFVCAM
jgi:hypothetical protein